MGAGKHLQADQVEMAASTVCFSPWGKETTVVAKGIDMAVDFGKKPVVFTFHRRESSCTE